MSDALVAFTFIFSIGATFLRISHLFTDSMKEFANESSQLSVFAEGICIGRSGHDLVESPYEAIHLDGFSK